jgi:hypothetical protein
MIIIMVVSVLASLSTLYQRDPIRSKGLEEWKDMPSSEPLTDPIAAR